MGILAEDIARVRAATDFVQVASEHMGPQLRVVLAVMVAIGCRRRSVRRRVVTLHPRH